MRTETGQAEWDSRGGEVAFRPIAREEEVRAPYRFHLILKARREDLKMSLNYLARRVGLDHSTLIKYENKTRRPTLKAVSLLADALQPPLATAQWRERFFASAGFVELDPMTLPVREDSDGNN